MVNYIGFEGNILEFASFAKIVWLGSGNILVVCV